MYPRVVPVSSGDLKKWRKTVAAAALVGFPDRIATGPVRVTCEFVFDKPKSNKDSHPINSRIPDIDKLLRAVLDALQAKATNGAGVIWDDSQVSELVASKRWAVDSETEGVYISLEAVHVVS